ncbi:MAG: PEP-CTERM sorting domain-containing protein [Leptolyngbyaceae cyanobacterium RM1_1_2]|nr:PEP-CTERM sorting domain-containing protein [Leptolyngbyaceae cyanobacterium RM1_1_2]
MDGVSKFDSISNDSAFNSFQDPETGRFFSFFGNQGDVVTIEALRLEQQFDPALWIFEGIFSDTTEFFGGFSDLIDFEDLGFLNFADDEIFNPGGSFGDPFVVVVLTLPGTGQYTAIMTEFLSGDDDGGDGLFDYQITARGIVNPPESVPEPTTVLALSIFAGLGCNLKRKLNLRKCS